MARRYTYGELVSRLLPAGALGVSLLLGGAVSGEAAVPPAAEIPAVAGPGVSARLADIRAAVSATGTETQATGAKEAGTQLAWGNWGNRGRRRGWNNWHNWHNWHNYR
jgi:hypothetical protein